MKLQLKLILMIVIVCSAIIFVADVVEYFKDITIARVTPTKIQPDKVTIAIVGCHDRTEQLINLIKSVLVYNVDQTSLHFVVLAEAHISPVVEENLYNWTKIVNFELTYEIHPTWFPKENYNDWRNLFRACSTQRLFFPV